MSDMVVKKIIGIQGTISKVGYTVLDGVSEYLILA
jgi:hypothetical protein